MMTVAEWKLKDHEWWCTQFLTAPLKLNLMVINSGAFMRSLRVILWESRMWTKCHDNPVIDTEIFHRFGTKFDLPVLLLEVTWGHQSLQSVQLMLSLCRKVLNLYVLYYKKMLKHWLTGICWTICFRILLFQCSIWPISFSDCEP